MNYFGRVRRTFAAFGSNIPYELHINVSYCKHRLLFLKPFSKKCKHDLHGKANFSNQGGKNTLQDLS